MILNGAVFLSDYEDKQESILVPVDLTNVATVIRNASTLEMFGVELEMLYQITEKWDLQITYGYLDAEYDDYLADLNGDNIITDNSDLTPRNTPENTFGITTSYTTTIGPGDLNGVVSYRYRDEIETNASNDPLGSLDDIDNVDATISYTLENYRIAVWGRNLTDEREQRWATIGGIATRGWWNEPRMYGVTLSASF